jgi:hypothetical protein
MVGSALALSLIGFGAVRALPARKGVEERQGSISIGDGTGIFIPGGGGELPPCLIDTPLNEQPPCFLSPITGGFEPPIPGPGEEKRESGASTAPTKRQITIGDGTGIFIPGQGSLSPCLTTIPISQQPPCFLPPLPGGFIPPTLHVPKGKRVTLPPDYASNTKKVIETLEKQLVALQNKPHKTDEDVQEIKALKSALLYLAGITNISAPPGTGTSFTPGKRDFKLPPDAEQNKKKVIQELEAQLIKLQNKPHKTREDLEDIKAIKEALFYLAGITSISAPPGSGSSFTPGKRDFKLPPDAEHNKKKVIEELEAQLIKLQNKPHKSREDIEDIKAIKEALLYLAGITSISAPPGSGSSFTPGKRDVAFSLDSVGTYASVCPGLEGAEIALQTLMHKDKHTVEERIIMQKLAAFLKGCGITIIKSPDGTFTIIKPSDKRDVSQSELNVAGLEAAYDELLKAAAEAGRPSFANWLVLQHIADLLDIYLSEPVDRSAKGIAAELSTVTEAEKAKRQSDTITVGTRTCQVADIMGLRAALAALLTAYGDPATSPANIFLVEQVIVSALQLCGQSVAGWTTLTPGSPIPGGPIVPQPTIPGGPMKPDPTIPGGPITPDPYIPGSPIKPSPRDAASEESELVLLDTLRVLESAYGGYGNTAVPAPVWWIMVNLVTVLQGMGVTVPGWPVLGQGTVVLTPSN